MAGVSVDFSQTPARQTLRVPVGHVVLSGKWRSTSIPGSLQGSVNVLYEDSLGVIDFHPASHIGVVYADEADLVSQATIRRKLAKLRKPLILYRNPFYGFQRGSCITQSNTVQVVVLAEKTRASSQYFPSFQKFVTMELGFSLVPVPGQTEAAGLLAQMVHTENKSDTNPFCKKRKPGNLDQALLATVQTIPKLGGIKAKQLLDRFPSLQQIADASIQDLEAVVGKASAQYVKNFFTTPAKT